MLWMENRRFLSTTTGSIQAGDSHDAHVLPRAGMMDIRRTLVLFAVAQLTACGLRTALPGQSGGAVDDVESLVEALRAAGATVEMAGEVSQPFFSVEGQVISVNRGDVQVFEYESEAAASEEAALVSAEGYTIGTSSVMWVARPYFHKAGRLVVLYVGDDDAVAAVLEEVLGPPFAGG
jgi:hypothetical protein